MNQLEKILIAKDYSYTKNESEEITITHDGNVYLNSLITLEPGTVFNNGGWLELNGLKDFDAINLGNQKRKIKIIKHKTKGLLVKLGCFFGNENEAIEAIRLRYGENSNYEIGLINAFNKYK